MPHPNFAPTLIALLKKNIKPDVDRTYVNELIEYFFSMNLSNDYFKTHSEAHSILHSLIKYKDQDLIIKYIDHFFEHPELLHNPERSYGITSLWLCIDNINIATLLVENLICQDIQYLQKAFEQYDHNDGSRILHLFLNNPQVDNHYIIEKLLSRIHELEQPQRILNALRTDWTTPLHLACKNKHFFSTVALINAGARIDVADKTGTTPLYLLVQGSKIKERKNLLKLVFKNLNEKNRIIFVDELYKLRRRYFYDEHLAENYTELLKATSLKQFYADYLITKYYGIKLKYRPDVNDILYATPKIGEPEIEDKSTDLQFSENQFDQLSAEIDRCLRTLNFYPTHDHGIRIITVTLLFLLTCLTAIVPYLFYNQAEKDGFFSDDYNPNDGSGYFVGFLLTVIFMGVATIAGAVIGLGWAWERKYKFTEEDLAIILRVVDILLEHLKSYQMLNLSIQMLNTHKQSIIKQDKYQVIHGAGLIKNEIQIVKNYCLLKQHSLFKKPEDHVIEIPDGPRLG